MFRGQNSNLYDGGKYFRESYGLGDVLLQARIQRTFFNEIPIILGIGVKLSNGKINMTDEFGERISDNLQVGTGTVDPILSIYSSQDIKNLVLSGGIFTRISNGENIYGYRYGNEIQTLVNLDYVENYLLMVDCKLVISYRPGIIMNMGKFQETEEAKAISLPGN